MSKSSEKKLPRQPIPVQSLAEFKRLMRPGTEFVTTEHANHPGIVGLVRVVGKVQSNAFYSTIKNQPKSKYSDCNDGKGMRTEFGKASEYRFEDGCVKVLDPKDSTGRKVLYAFEVYGIPQVMTKSEEKKQVEIKEITTDDLRQMSNREGLIIQGCGGDLQVWVDGINDLLTIENVLRNGTRMEHVSAFTHEGVSCLLFHLEDADVDVGKLAIWRLQTHGSFGGTWLSDYVPNRLGGFLSTQPEEEPEPDEGPEMTM